MILIEPNSKLYRRFIRIKGGNGNRALIKRLLVQVIMTPLETLRQITHRRDIATIRGLSLFSPPYDSGPDKTIAKLAVQSANQTFPFMVHFIEVANNERFSEPTPITLFSNTARAQNAAIELKSMFDQHGSDKATLHNYHHLYGEILEDLRYSTVTILEIGLGTNNLDVASHMGPGGRPGASLRAFAEFLPRACIYGADIDRRILFQEARIKTFFVDQTNPQSLRSLASQVECKFDLIIDDGLHSPNANIATLSFACDNLKEGGWFVVEDIQTAAIPIWRVVSALLPKNYRSWIIAAEDGFLFVIRRNGPRQTDDSVEPPLSEVSAGRPQIGEPTGSPVRRSEGTDRCPPRIAESMRHRPRRPGRRRRRSGASRSLGNSWPTTNNPRDPAQLGLGAILRP
jgi:hypothetical protein